MKRILLTTVLLTVVAGGGWVAAQTPAAPKPAPAMAGPGPRGRMMGGDSMPMGRGMNGGGMMGGGMMGGGMCSMMMGGSDTKIEVKKIDKGVTITLTSSDAATTTRLQKMAEAMRLMHEAMTE
jgi:hypothetical protein